MQYSNKLLNKNNNNNNNILKDDDLENYFEIWNNILKKSNLQGVKFFKFKCKPFLDKKGLLNYSKEEIKSLAIDWVKSQFLYRQNEQNGISEEPIPDYFGLNVDLINFLYFSTKKYPIGHEKQGFYYLEGILGIQTLLPNDENLILLNLESLTPNKSKMYGTYTSRVFCFKYLGSVKEIQEFFFNIHKDLYKNKIS